MPDLRAPARLQEGGGHHLGGYSPAQMMGKEKITAAWGKEV